MAAKRCPLTDIPGEIGELSWSPDGKRLLCTVRKFDPDELERQKDEDKKKLGVVARHYERLFYKLDGFGYLPHERWHSMVGGRAHRKSQTAHRSPRFR